ncbi:hypothetical protein EJ08DRAFT_31435 [Tothia fuscella]|uniref:Uncharacterized protein n=1 Tax=Tothia fuscella TaxID=1048955 RepID=A0A9P4NGE4_9PEZI|nr:hypothetical protein EJ08DRAFT_31435 [Tothia fuscella]
MADALANEVDCNSEKRQKQSVSEDTDTMQAMQAISKHDSSTPLLRLPREIRDQIYRLLLGDREACFQSIWADSDCKLRDISVVFANPITLNILSTCMQIYSEARLLPFTSNNFQGWFDEEDNLCDLEEKLLPYQRQAVRSMDLCTASDNFIQAQHLSLVTSFSGLRHLRLFMLLTFSDENSLVSTEEQQAVLAVALKDAHCVFSYFRRFSLPSLSVEVHSLDISLGTATERQTLRATIKDEVLKPWDKEEFKKRHLDRREKYKTELEEAVAKQKDLERIDTSEFEDFERGQWEEEQGERENDVYCAERHFRELDELMEGSWKMHQKKMISDGTETEQ